MNGLRLFCWLMLLSVLLLGCNGPAADTPSILFLRPPDDDGAAQLFAQPLGGEARQLTGVGDPSAPEVIDYAPAPDGERIVYATQAGSDTALRLVEPDGGGDRRLLDCPAAECAAPVWSPDGTRLLVERRQLDGGLPGPPRLVWLDPDTGATQPLITGDPPAHGARFSPGGDWLSYVSPGDAGVVLYRLADGAQRLLPSWAGAPAAWSPDGAAVVYGDLVPAAHAADEAGAPPLETAGVYLYRTLLAEEGSRQRLSPEAAVSDSAAAFAPDGQWLAFSRAPAETNAARQLWLMRPDGSEARALTAEATVSHGPPRWSADGRTLLYQRLDASPETASTPRLSIWQLDVATGAATLVVEDGYLPLWLP